MKRNSNRKKEGKVTSPLGRNVGELSGMPSFYESEETKRVFADRMKYLLVNSLGCTAIVTIITGVKYSGLLVACNHTSMNGIDVILKFPKVIDKGIDGEDISTLSEKLGDSLLIDGNDLAELELKEVDFGADEKWEQTIKKQADEQKLKERDEEGKRVGFKTDTDISGASTEVKTRQLKKWSSNCADTFGSDNILQDLDETWDQFAVNEEKFGIKSTFDEHLYTTEINKEDPNYEIRLKQADRLAKEIESSNTTNVHVAEDRGLIFEDFDMDEEDKYSGIDRRGDELLAQLKMNSTPVVGKPQRYIAPGLRCEPHNIDPVILTSSKKVRSSSLNKNPVEKKTQMIDSKKISEKFKGPYRTLDDMKILSKSSEGLNSMSALKKPEELNFQALSMKPNNSRSQIVVEKPEPSKAEESKPKTLTPEGSKFQTVTKKLGDSKSQECPKKPEESKSQATVKKLEDSELRSSSLKLNPLLPPKPIAVKSITSTASNICVTAGKPTIRSSKPITPAQSKTELRKSSTKLVSQSSHTPTSSPSTGRSNQYRRHNTSPFFDDEAPKCVKKDFSKDFNMFLKAKAIYDLKFAEKKNTEPFTTERPYFTTPTWISTIEKSFKTLFPDERTAIHKTHLRLQQRTLNSMGGNMSMGGIPGMMAIPVGPGGSQSIPLMSSPGMFMPFQLQPMFYPPVPQMLAMVGTVADDRGNDTYGHSQGNNSTHGVPNFMNNGIPLGPFTYPASYQPIMAPLGVGSNGNGSGLGGSGSNYKGYYHNHNNGHRYHRHR